MNTIPCQILELTKKYNAVLACDNVTFNIKSGEILGFIGANGAGKTTTINSIMGLTIPTSGSVTLFQKDAINEGGIVRKNVGFASGEPSFFPKLTVEENLKFIADVKGVGYDRINYLASKLELNLSRKVKELSLGNKKKVAIVGALLSSPKLIILDEPTEGLDPLIRQSFFKLMEEEKQRGASILISSHSLTDIQRLCDRVVIINKGKVISIEQMEELKLKRLKVVTIETSYSNPPVTLSGVSGLVQEANFVKFNYNGEMKKLVNYLNSIDIVNVQITDANLENLFLHFYE